MKSDCFLGFFRSRYNSRSRRRSARLKAYISVIDDERPSFKAHALGTRSHARGYAPSDSTPSDESNETLIQIAAEIRTGVNG